ncbi:MAG: winged helix-turn-helix domain-containing protein [Nitrospinales bacterium]
MSKKETSRISCRPRFRILYGKEIALGPGKVDLLEAIQRAGSISAAAREMGLSYRRAWGMVDVMNRCFQKPLVSSTTGGKRGGGASLTELGQKVTRLYRTMESKSKKASQGEWKVLQKALKKAD